MPVDRIERPGGGELLVPAARASEDLRRFPFAVGAVGHRDLVVDDLPAIAQEVAAFLDAVGRRVPRVRLELVTGLAPGADLLVAEVALDLGLDVTGLLPMPWELYRADFAADDLARVERILDFPRAHVRQLPLPVEIDLTRARDPGIDRDRFYVALMEYLVRRSNVLLALWDGAVTGLPGGTGDVVSRYVSSGGGDVAAWIEVRRSPADPRPEPRTRWVTAVTGGVTPVASPHPPEALESRLDALDGHLADHAALVASGAAPAAPDLLRSADELVGPQRALLEPVAAEFARADALASHHQRRSNLVFRLLGLDAGAMGLFFLLYAKVDALAVYLVAYLALAAAGYALFAVARRREWFTRHLADRVAAEALRVRFHLAAAGTGDGGAAERLADRMGIGRLRGFAWVRDAWRVGALPEDGAAGVDAEAVERVRRDWVDDQAAYFRARLAALSHRHERLERVRAALFVLSLAGAVALILFSHELGEVDLTPEVDLKTAVLVLMGLLPLWLGVWEIYQGKMATRELIWQYRNQADHFTRASAAIAGARTPADRRGVLVELGERALFEVCLWSLHRVHREHEPSMPG